MPSFNVSTATTAELVAFFNANTGGAQVKKFADRKTAERRVQLLLDEMVADGDLVRTDATSVLTDECGSEDPTQAEIDESNADTSSVYACVVHGHTHCPGCGVHLSNGVGEHLQEVNGNYVYHDAFQYECLACGHEFGPAITQEAAPPTPVAHTLRPAMSASMKLDRQILDVTSGVIYANACRVWKAGVISSSQCDRLSGVLYGAAKQGNRLMSLSVAGHVFTLAVK